MRTIWQLAMAGVLAFVASGADAALIFSDDFDQDAADDGTVLNFDGFDHWTVDNGTVDLLRDPNIFGLSCAGGSTGCVDSDGTTNDAGRMVTRALFTFSAGTQYNFFLDYAGSQRGDVNSELVQVVSADASSVIVGSGISNVPSAQPWTTAGFGWTPATSVQGRVALVGQGGDNLGLLMDNFVLCNNNDCSAASVPEPGSLALLLAPLLLLGVARRR